MEKELEELICISRRTGSDKSLVLGAFGNTSVKTDDGRYMYIKASGTSLADMNESSGWRRLCLDELRSALCDPEVSKMETVKRDQFVSNCLMKSTSDDFPDDIRPSVESSFHALLDKYVVHLHPAAVLGYACSIKGKELISDLFGDPQFTPVWVPHASFGMELALQIADAAKEYVIAHGCAPRIYVFQNHGLAVTSNDKESIFELLDSCMNVFKSRFEKVAQAPEIKVSNPNIETAREQIGRAIGMVTGGEIAVRYYIDDNVRGVMAREDAEDIISSGAVTFDELIGAGGGPVWLNCFDDIEYMSKIISEVAGSSPVMPKGYYVKDVGLFIVCDESDFDQISDFLSSYLAVRVFAADNGGINSANPAKYMRYVKSK